MRKRSWKNILSIALAALVLFGAVGAVAAFAMNDTKPAGAVFKVGDIDSLTGEFIESEKSIYTENLISSAGLCVSPSFDFKGSYDVFYYNENNVFITKKTGLKGTYKSTVDVAPYCRIVVRPDVPTGENVNKFKLNLLDVLKISNKFNITCSVESTDNYDDILYGVYYNNGYSFEMDEQGQIIGKDLVESSDSLVSDFVSLNGVKKIRVVSSHVYPPHNEFLKLVFLDKNGEFLSTMSFVLNSSDTLFTTVFDVPDGAVEVAVTTCDKITTSLYIYND